MRYTFSPRDLDTIEKIAKIWYDTATYNHAMRVYNFVYTDPKVTLKDFSFCNYCLALAICHDLFEDTECSQSMFNEELTRGINILTRKPNESYISYCDRINIRNKPNNYYINEVDLAAWYVKLADMKDHLTQTATLTIDLKLSI